MEGALEFHCTVHKDTMQIDVTISEITADGMREFRKGTLVNEDAVDGILCLVGLKRLLGEESRVG